MLYYLPAKGKARVIWLLPGDCIHPDDENYRLLNFDLFALRLFLLGYG